MQKEQFGILLTTLRKKNGISQKEMAERLSVSVSAVSKWEHGKNLPDMTILGKIAEILQVSCDELMNPEKTLEKLTNPEVPEEDAEKKHSRILKIAVLAGIALIVIGMVLLYMAVCGKADFEQVGSRYIDDPYWGKVYDIAAVVHGRTDEDLLITHMEEVREQVKEGPELGTNIVRITYFKKKSDALKWENPESYSYIFLNADGQAYPSYFDPVIQELTSGWTTYREGHPTSGLMDAFCDRGVSNGGREENGLFISYLDYETDAEPQYVFFHLEDLLTDAAAAEWDWASAGAFRGILEQDDVTVYSAEVAEAIDVPAAGMVFVAVRGNQPIAYMSVDLTAGDITQGVKIATAK